MTLKLLAPLALLLGILGGGASSMEINCCAPGAECCNPPQECCGVANTSTNANDWCGCECCAPGSQCCGACCGK